VFDSKLKALGFKPGASKYMTHGVGHGLGLDVHDCSGVGSRLDEGYVFTIEPGLYFPLDDTDVPKAYRGMDIRIEDNCIALNGDVTCPSMTAARTVSEIEAICGKVHKSK
jgi:Xaa-Pro aminopeptidase